ncbi:MAG: rhomboid family intramembrane serine protease [Flavobacteriales bacterium]|nr:rhomboid family intramembrane serine protease [Flavobacteriales bacterium]
MFDFKNLPPVVKKLLIINGLFFVATLLLKNQGIDLADYLGLHYWKSEGFQPYQLVTYMFMHGGFTHVLFNMFAVYMFGRVLEGVWGQKRFLIFYMVTGIGAGLIQMLVAHIRLMPLMADLPPEDINMIMTEGYDLLQSGRNWVGVGGTINGLINGVTVGASGAVFGILLAFGMLLPNTELMLLFPPIPIKAKWFVLGYGAIELYSGFANNPNDNVAHFAHLGGMLFGFIMIQYWKKDRGNFY